ncbi:protein MIZU-KUSSEI 1-like [Andrographis paniculata]|uniref:protein MIZU-KUSSEI 1-like n=1 Tax=Andrographis paniculata TaxID=175694 RepID=UPI0021E75A76|nr:protein MIZU-KUSSEI 1-like [Andrographis paniculata]
MKTIMAHNPHDTFSLSRRYLPWKKKLSEEDDADSMDEERSKPSDQDPKKTAPTTKHQQQQNSISSRKKFSAIAVSKLRSALTLGRARFSSSGLGSRVVGTLFGNRRGHVRFAFQEGFNLTPAFLVELATPTSVLVKEMASGLVRIALECDKKKGREGEKKGAGLGLLEEPVWRTYCNGKKCGYAARRECGPDEWKVLNAIGPISMGAGVLPVPVPVPGGSDNGEMMYMRARFERVVGSKDSEAFYMMNPDGNNGGPELSIYLLRF